MQFYALLIFMLGPKVSAYEVGLITHPDSVAAFKFTPNFLKYPMPG